MRAICANILFKLAGHGHKDMQLHVRSESHAFEHSTGELYSALTVHWTINENVTDAAESSVGHFQTEDLLADVSDQGIW